MVHLCGVCVCICGLCVYGYMYACAVYVCGVGMYGVILYAMNGQCVHDQAQTILLVPPLGTRNFLCPPASSDGRGSLVGRVSGVHRGGCHDFHM